MALRQLWKLLSGAALLAIGVVFGVSAPASAGGAQACVGDIIVALDVHTWSRPGHDTWPITLAEPLAPGEWSVGVVSLDEYDGRAKTNQKQEQWLLEIVGHATLGPTTDLADDVDSASVADQLGTFVADVAVTDVVVRHAAPSTRGGTNSVTAVCAGFSLLEAEPATTTTTTTTTSTTTTTTTLPASTTSTTTTTTTLPASTTTSTTSTTTTTRRPAPPAPAPPTPPPLPESAVIAASATVDCASAEVFVLVGNQGSAGATVDLALPLADVRPGVEVGPGTITSTTLALADLEDVETEVRVSDASTGEVYARAPVAVDCAAAASPVATAVLDCPAGVVVVFLRNEGGAPAQLTVLHERVAVVDEVRLPAGENREIEIPLDAAPTVAVRVVDADGVDVLRADIDNVCPVSGPAATDDDVEPAPQPPPSSASPSGPVACSGADPRGDVFDIRVGTDGAVTVSGSTARDATIPVTPGTPVHIRVSEGAAAGPAGVGCAEVRVVVEPDCGAASAAVSIERRGPGRERFVVLVDGRAVGGLAIDGTGRGAVPFALGDGDVRLTVSRSFIETPVVTGVVSCTSRAGPAGPIAASMVVIAVLATLTAVLPWPARARAG